MTAPDPDILTDLALAHLAYLAGERPDPPRLDHLNREEQQRAHWIFAALDAAWRSDELEPPPLASHPLALSFGLVPDPTRPLSPSALSTARRRARLTVSELAARLRARGWDVRSGTVMQWEQLPAAAAAVPPAIITALSEELGVPADRLLGIPAAVPPDITALAATPRFAALARRWARAVGLPDDQRGAAALQQLMLAGAVRRGDELGQEAWFAALEALVAAREQREAGL